MPINPYVYSQGLLQGYINSYKRFLTEFSVSPDIIAQIIENLNIKKSIFISLNRRPKASPRTVQETARELGWSEGLTAAIPKNIERFHEHQKTAFHCIKNRENVLLSTGTGSGKTESFLYPIIDYCLKNRSQSGIKAVIIYPMNALLDDQFNRINKIVNTEIKNYPFLKDVRADKFIGASTSEERTERKNVIKNPPQILLTNPQMLDRIFVNPEFRNLREALKSLSFFVLDEVHHYTGSAAVHIKYLINRLRSEQLDFRIIAASATLVLNSDSTGLMKPLYETSDRLKEYGRDLFGVEEITLIEPTFEVEQTTHPEKKEFEFEITGSIVEKYNRNFTDILREALNILGVEEKELLLRIGDLESQEVQAVFEKTINLLKQHPITQIILHALQDSPRSIDDLSEEIKPFLTNPNIADKVLELFLIVISYFNERVTQKTTPLKPILDFRLYLFVKGLMGALSVCPNCKQYYSEEADRCPQCHGDLFSVYAKDLRKYFAAKHNGQFLPKKTGNSIWMLRDLDDPDNFKAWPENEIEEVRFTLSEGNDILPAAKQLIDIMVVNSIPEERSGARKEIFYKILAFVNARNKTTRYKLENKDYFAEQFYFYILKKIEISGLNINTIGEFFLNDIQSEVTHLEQDRQENIIACAVIWYRRFLFEHPQYSKKILCMTKEYSDPIVMLLLDLLLEYRYIYINVGGKEYNNTSPERLKKLTFLVFNKSLALQKRGFYISELSPDDKQELKKNGYAPFSLLSQGDLVKRAFNLYKGDPEKYRDSSCLSDKVMPITIDDLAKIFKGIIEGLCKEKVIVKSEKYPIYALDSSHVSFTPSFQPILSGCIKNNKSFLNIYGHSSEQKENTENIQQAFFDIAFATSTLEMGVDIKDLSQVVMIGIPPTPSNFIQRAGRAGRGRDLKYATIISLCSDKDAHDLFYFENPLPIIKGVMPLTRIKAFSKKALTQHIRAFILSKAELKKEILLEECLRVFTRDEEKYDKAKEWIHRYFDTFDKEMYFQPDINKLYKEKQLPDYDFAENNYSIVDVTEGEFELLKEDVFSVTRTYIPTKKIYLGGKVYSILPDSVAPLDSAPNVYKHLEKIKLVQDVGYAHPSRQDNYMTISFNPDTLSGLTVDLPANNNGSPLLRITYCEALEMYLTANEKLPPKLSEGNEDVPKANNRLQNMAHREGLLLEFPMSSISNNGFCETIASVLTLHLKLQQSLNDNEIAFECVKNKREDENKSIYFYIFNKNENESVFFEDVIFDYRAIFSTIIKSIQSCSCQNKAGCYLCTLSYASRMYMARIFKEKAIKYFEVLLGDKKFSPEIDIIPSKKVGGDLIITGKEIIFRAGGVLYREPRDYADKYKTIYKTLYTIMEKAQEHLIKGMAVSVNCTDNWIIDQLRFENKVDLEYKDSFGRFQEFIAKYNITFVK